jgi:adenylate cyclase
VSGLYPGVEVHANLLAGMLDSGSIPFKSEPPFSTFLELVGLLVIGIVLAVLMAYLPALPAAILFVLSFAAAVATNVMGWQQGYALPLAPFLLLIGLIYFSNVAYGYFVESKNKRQLADLFGQYVPPELVDKMAENPLQYSMAARKHTLTVLFSDVVGFTSISEKLTPSELTEFINEYLSEMSFVIRKKGGTLDKYIGDAIMAFWGAPIDDEDHATNGVLAALGMHEKLQELKKAYKEKNWPDINVGIGLSTGPMTVGDMGSVIRKAYTVMGDAVNLGSRLEGITRQYFVNILVSEETMQATKGILFRDIDMVRVKGKDNPITIYEPIAEIAKISAEVQEKITTWNAMIKSYRLQHWSDAESKLHGLIAADANNKLYQLYADRIAFFKTNPPPSDWDGVTKFETK